MSSSGRRRRTLRKAASAALDKARRCVPPHDGKRHRPGRSRQRVKTTSPSIHVETPARRRSRGRGVEGVTVEEDEVGDRPGSTSPASSRWYTHADPEVYAAKATSRDEELVGQERLAPGTPRFPVRHPVDRDVDRLERIGGADRPVAAGDETGTGAVQVAERVLARRPAPSPRNGMVRSTIWSS